MTSACKIRITLIRHFRPDILWICEGGYSNPEIKYFKDWCKHGFEFLRDRPLGQGKEVFSGWWTSRVTSKMTRPKPDYGNALDFGFGGPYLRHSREI